MADVEYTGTGLVDNKTEEGIMAPVHLNGVATKMDGTRVKFKSEC